MQKFWRVGKVVRLTTVKPTSGYLFQPNYSYNVEASNHQQFSSPLNTRPRINNVEESGQEFIVPNVDLQSSTGEIQMRRRDSPTHTFLHTIVQGVFNTAVRIYRSFRLLE
eukprot:TRINITY_DN1424_c0_g1_i1.p1 TRINITY_DN1424_c0_g1~~TRINITY_DN1424_c0_g1_i1.p1  ORF type:complete len:110 (-),score=15.41 TRINITY_DN1424_c0_g1_i1:48-377(-)